MKRDLCYCTMDQAELGLLLRNKRVSRKLTQRVMAERMKISPAYLCDLEQGKRQWNAAIVLRFHNALKGAK